MGYKFEKNVSPSREPNHDARFIRRLRAWFDVYGIGFVETSVAYSHQYVIVFDDIKRPKFPRSRGIHDKSEARSLTIVLDKDIKVVFSRKCPDGFTMRIVKDGKQHGRTLHIEEAMDISRFFGFNEEIEC